MAKDQKLPKGTQLNKKLQKKKEKNFMGSAKAEKPLFKKDKPAIKDSLRKAGAEQKISKFCKGSKRKPASCMKVDKRDQRSF